MKHTYICPMREKGEASDFRNPRGRYKFDGRSDSRPLYDFFSSPAFLLARAARTKTRAENSPLLEKRLKEVLIPRDPGNTKVTFSIEERTNRFEQCY